MTYLHLLIENWTQVLSLLTSIGAGIGWLRERGKRMRDNRESDVKFWTQTIETQNAYIARQDARIATLEAKYESRIKVLEQQNADQKRVIEDMQHEIKELSDRLEKYEPVNKRIKK